MRIRWDTPRVAECLLLAALAGCAQTTVQPVREALDVTMPRPQTVLVYKFAVNMAEVQENQGIFQKAINAAESTTQDEQTREIAQDVWNRLADELVVRITGLGLPAQRASRDTYVPSDAVVVAGHFVDIDEGNRAQRLVIGFGAGQSKVDTQMQVLAPSRSGYRTLLEFDTHADSGEMPGAAVTMGAGAAAQGTVTAGMAAANVAATGFKGYRSQVDVMAKRTADRASDYLSRFFARQGWISPDKVTKPLLGTQ